MTKIFVPKEWIGITKNVGIFNMGYLLNPKACIAEQEAITNGKQDEFKQGIETRKQLIQKIESLGIEIKEGSPVFLEKDEYTILGSYLPYLDEIGYLKEYIPDIRGPKSYNLNEYKKIESFPVVIKNHKSNRGKEKIFIENKEQLESVVKNLEKSDSDINNYIIQEFIETPGQNYTSYRVIVSATGQILASGLFFSGHSKNERDSNYKIDGSELKYKDIRSNISQGGNSIVFNKKDEYFPKLDKKILKEHGIETKNPQLPETLKRWSEIIGKTLGKRKGLYVGIDFIQDLDGNFYYLETNSNPGLDLYAKYHNLNSYDETHKKITDEALEEILKK